MSQLALPLQLADHAIFASFYAAGNEALVSTLTAIAVESGENCDCWFWGGDASGKTHLMQALCAAAGDRAVYVPVSQFAAGDAGILDGLASREFIGIDDIDRVAGNASWEAALFDLCNQVFDAGGHLIISARSAPRECGFELADLVSRFSRLPVFQLHALADSQCVAALQLRSRYRGLDLPDDTAEYLLRRSRRDMASLYSLLDRLDKAALRAKRRLTIPFVRGVLEAGDSLD